MVTDDRFDELIFDYLEGTLARDEHDTVEFLKARSETFNLQVRMWQKAYMKEPLPVIEELRIKLLIKPSTPFSSVTNKLLILLLSLILISSNEVVDAAHGNKVLQVVPSSSQNAVGIIVDTLSVRYMDVNKVIPTPNRSEVREILLTREVDEIQLTLIPKSYQPLFEVRTLTDINLTGIQENASQAQQKRLTRKETRQLRASKRKNYRTRLERGFMSGNTPYVVPLESKDF